jgi:hypothetical protein
VKTLRDDIAETIEAVARFSERYEVIEIGNLDQCADAAIQALRSWLEAEGLVETVAQTLRNHYAEDEIEDWLDGARAVIATIAQRAGEHNGGQ